MRKKENIKYLTILTLTVLGGIVVLQVYWIIASYHQQKSRFKADIQNALSSANVKTTLKMAYARQQDGGLAAAFDLNSLIEAVEGSRKQNRNSDKNAFVISTNNIQIKDSLKLLEYLKKSLDPAQAYSASTIKFEIKDNDMELYKIAFQNELYAREIHIPFELAVVNNMGNIGWSTCDSAQFKKIAFKSDMEEFPQVKTKSTWGLMAAFPDSNLYLLQRMALILSISILLILIGTLSLGYLLVFFFSQKKLSDMRVDFINNMTHELKTPISSMSVALEMVLDEKKELNIEKKQSYISIAQKELKRLDILTENILRIMSMDREEMKIVKTHIQLLPWLEDIKESMSPLLEQKGAHLNIVVMPQNSELFADRIHMTNVMHNIIENAIKYNDKETPEINIRVTRHKNQSSLVISDNGEGIPSQYIKNVFDKFFRVPKGDRHDVKGFGLGLSYVKKIVEMHEGTIQVSSVQKAGSVFTIDLPLN